MNGNQDGDDILDTGDLDGDPGFEDFDTGQKVNFQDALKNNPTMKFGLVIGAIVLIAGGVILFGGGDEAPLMPSAVGRGSAVKETPGMKELSKGYEEALIEKNEQTLTQALQQGGSAIPVPIGPPKNRLEAQPPAVVEDPLERWKRVQEERMRKEKEAGQPVIGNQPEAGPARPVDPYAEDKKNLAGSFASQMESILEAQTPKASKILNVTDPKAFAEERARLAAEKVAANAQAAAAEADGTEVVEILLPAGKIEYGQLVIEANSDIPGPVLAELASGPLAGSRLIGSFKNNKDYITLTFNTIVVDGVAIATDAIAIDPGTSMTGMVTEIDRRYFERVILPAAAAFIKGIGGAIADSGSTTVSAGSGTTTSAENDLDTRQEFFKGVEEAADQIGEILENNKVAPLLRVAAGTHIGILFLQSVENTPLRSSTVAQTTQQQMPMGFPPYMQQMPGMPQSYSPQVYSPQGLLPQGSVAQPTMPSMQ